MTAITTSIPPPSRPREFPAASVAGAAYVGAWIIGLTAFGVGLDADASELAVLAHYADHGLSTAGQSVLVHGVAAAALLVVLIAVARAGARTRTAHLAGLVGVGLSIVQLALGLWRSLGAPDTTIPTLVEVIDRVDGVKILAFALMIAAALPALRRAGWVGRRMGIVGVAASGALAVAGVAYLLAIEPLMVFAAPALVLLLVWVARLGIIADRHRV